MFWAERKYKFAKNTNVPHGNQSLPLRVSKRLVFIREPQRYINHGAADQSITKGKVFEDDHRFYRYDAYAWDAAKAIGARCKPLPTVQYGFICRGTCVRMRQRFSTGKAKVLSRGSAQSLFLVKHNLVVVQSATNKTQVVRFATRSRVLPARLADARYNFAPNSFGELYRLDTR